MRLRYLGIFILSLTLILGFAACTGNNTSNPPTTEGVFRSDKYHLTVKLPSGWAASEGSQLELANRFYAEVSFNSWGEKDFWGREMQIGNTHLYGPDEVIRQVPEGGAYVDLIYYAWPPHEGIPDYNLNNLSGLWQPHDLRQDTPNSFKRIDFYKWERHLILGIYCSPRASNITVAQLNDLLQSWKWDTLPAGDVGWAFDEAIKLLPQEIEPSKFPTSGGEGPRLTQANVGLDKTVHFRFTYTWKYSAPPGVLTPLPDSSRWWNIDVLSTGKAVLTGEGGAPLP